LGRAAPRAEWEQRPTWQNNGLRFKQNATETGDVRACAGDYLICAQWYDFVKATPNGREHKVSKEPSHVPTVNNYVDLVAVDFKQQMQQVTGDAGSAMSRRRACRTV
jgi:hypothetical protein